MITLTNYDQSLQQKKWIKVNDLSGSQHSVNKNIKCKTPM